MDEKSGKPRDQTDILPLFSEKGASLSMDFVKQCSEFLNPDETHARGADLPLYDYYMQATSITIFRNLRRGYICQWSVVSDHHIKSALNV